LLGECLSRGACVMAGNFVQEEAQLCSGHSVQL